ACRVLFRNLEAPYPQEARLARHVLHVAAFQPAHDLGLPAGGDPEAHHQEKPRFSHLLGATLQTSAANTANSTIALSASDKCMPIRLPPMPTVTPAKARRPRADILNSPITRPRACGGALTWTSVCAMA